MKLITKEIEKQLEKHPLYSTEEVPVEQKKVIVKYFGGSACTWLVYEGEKQSNGDWLFFGNVTLNGEDWELGYFTLSQLQELRFPPFGLPIERDLYM